MAARATHLINSIAEMTARLAQAHGALPQFQDLRNTATETIERIHQVFAKNQPQTTAQRSSKDTSSITEPSTPLSPAITASTRESARIQNRIDYIQSLIDQLKTLKGINEFVKIKREWDTLTIHEKDEENIFDLIRKDRSKMRDEITTQSDKFIEFLIQMLDLSRKIHEAYEESAETPNLLEGKIHRTLEDLVGNLDSFMDQKVYPLLDNIRLVALDYSDFQLNIKTRLDKFEEDYNNFETYRKQVITQANEGDEITCRKLLKSVTSNLYDYETEKLELLRISPIDKRVGILDKLKEKTALLRMELFGIHLEKINQKLANFELKMRELATENLGEIQQLFEIVETCQRKIEKLLNELHVSSTNSFRKSLIHSKDEYENVLKRIKTLEEIVQHSLYQETRVREEADEE